MGSVTGLVRLLRQARDDWVRRRHLEVAPALEAVYSPTEPVRGRHGRRLEGASLSSLRNVTALRSLMRKHRPRRTLEVGLALGGSAVGMVDMHRALGTGAPAVHVAIDPFQSTVWDDAGRVALERAGLAALVEVIERPSHVALADLASRGARFGLAYIDGSHLFEDCFVDFVLCADLVHEGGIIVLDDCLDPHVRKVVRFIRENLDSFEELDVVAYRSLGRFEEMEQRALKGLRGLQQAAFVKTRAAWRRSWDSAFADF
ncbi:MAG: class I SAM-dependent methyltransferase [Planctomycetes bacterium]|nr:class I SAM-dependent methyltransferase [Planctomycetota bacterium]